MKLFPCKQMKNFQSTKIVPHKFYFKNSTVYGTIINLLKTILMEFFGIKDDMKNWLYSNTKSSIYLCMHVFFFKNFRSVIQVVLLY